MRLIEPFAVVDTFTYGLGRVEVLRGGYVRLTYFSEMTVEGDIPERVVVAKILIPKDGIQDGWRLITQALAEAVRPNEVRMVGAAH